jgi:hypothetical protein
MVNLEYLSTGYANTSSNPEGVSILHGAVA